jgi:hypothetical protein
MGLNGYKGGGVIMRELREGSLRGQVTGESARLVLRVVVRDQTQAGRARESQPRDVGNDNRTHCNIDPSSAR